MGNIGRKITDGYCGGAFGREYDLYGAEIISEGDKYVVIRKENGIVMFSSFQEWDWNRNEDGTLSGGISNLRNWSPRIVQETIDGWCGEY